MRFFSFLITVILLSSCATMYRGGQLRMVKTEKSDVPIIVRNTASESQSMTESSISNIEQGSNTVASIEQDHSLIQQNNPPSTAHSETESEDLEPDPEENEVDKQEMIDQAYRAEKQARTSVPILASGLISIFMPYIGIFLFLTGLVFYNKATTSRYITPFGEEKLRVAKLFLIFDSVILGLWLLFIILLLLLLLL